MSTYLSGRDYTQLTTFKMFTRVCHLNKTIKMINNSEISISDFGKICRTCLSKGEMKCFYKDCCEDNCLVEMLMSISFIQVSEKDGLPHQICLNCESELNKAYNFAQKCIEVDKKLKNVLQRVTMQSKSTQSKTVYCKISDKINISNALKNEQENSKIKIEDNTIKGNSNDLILIRNENLLMNEHAYYIKQNVVKDNFLETKNENNNYCDNCCPQNNFSDANANIIDEINQTSDSKSKEKQITRKIAAPRTKKLKENETNCDNNDEILPHNENNFSDTNINKNSNSKLAPRTKKLKPNDINCDETLPENDNNLSDTSISDNIRENSYLEPNKKQNKKEKMRGPPYECKKCFETFGTSKLLWLHWQEVKHPPNYKSSCRICLKQVSYGKMKQHMRIHTSEKPYACEACGKSFSLKSNLERHVKMHTGVKPHKCHICEKAFIQSTSLKEHLRFHTGDKFYICNFCGKKFTENGFYKMHLLKFHDSRSPKKLAPDRSAEPQHECGTCHKKFHSKAVLRNHTLIHGEKKFLCNHCGVSFFTKGRLDIHLKVHTGEKPYSCEICGKTFSQSGSLKSHILTHTGEKPYVCKICDRRFTQGQHLAYHLRTHSDEKPFSCVFCGKCFSQKCNLRIHTRIHTGETPYLCPICNKGFYDCSSMHKHKRKHEQSTV